MIDPHVLSVLEDYLKQCEERHNRAFNRYIDVFTGGITRGRKCSEKTQEKAKRDADRAQKQLIIAQNLLEIAMDRPQIGNTHGQD